MIIDEFIEWQSQKSEFEGFKIFADEWINDHRTGIVGVLQDLMYQVYTAQCCIEGLIEDMEFTEKKKVTEKKGEKQ